MVLSPVTASRCRAPDGRDVPWVGFFTGHRVLDEPRIAECAERLLGMDLGGVEQAVGTELRPYRAATGAQRGPALLLHSATPMLRAFEGDLDAVANGDPPHDSSTYVEARSVFFCTADDLCVGRTAPWAEAAELRGVPAVDVGGVDHYYLIHALLLLAEAHEDGADTRLGRVVDWLRAHPGAVVRLYALDVETQILLLWLRRTTGLPTLTTDANSTVVSTRWNRKSHIHPTVAAALGLPEPMLRLPAEHLLDAEQRRSEAHLRLGLRLPVLPGYTVPRAGVTTHDFVRGVLTAADLLRHRYGLRTAALKPSDSADGARIIGRLDLRDTDRLAAEAAAAHVRGDDHILEAWVTFHTVTLDGARLPVAPSGHIRDGHLADGLTLQLLDGYSWRGNIYLDEEGWTGLGLPGATYRTIRASLDAVRSAFQGHRSIADGSHRGLVRGGVDFAVGRLGGRFGASPVVGAIDFNLSSNGGETLRAFQDIARRQGIPERYAATRIFHPPRTQTLRRMRHTAAALTPPEGMMEAIACIPRRWGMVAATGDGPERAVRRVGAMVAASTTP
ncbi:hypothetical protein HNR23_003636 [Nocardiopsis mwathae]|uniref:Uncharacterized protein n=1 Tax=Nocardiopsis mwathae TaxID=1472723 RepID=A0A7W9YLW0_9ACTN|nr:hypothetical protein [Nocardiopsis mwathae]MBB6173576.1 hypothetical protein [Nocardiopsis mwathae]